MDFEEEEEAPDIARGRSDFRAWGVVRIRASSSVATKSSSRVCFPDTSPQIVTKAASLESCLL